MVPDGRRMQPLTGAARTRPWKILSGIATELTREQPFGIATELTREQPFGIAELQSALGEDLDGIMV